MASAKTLTIFMYPWFGMGHITPYLVTANKFAKRGHKIFIIIPPKAQSKLGPLNLHPQLIQFLPISVPLLIDSETTNDVVSVQGNQLLRHALDLTQPAVESLLREIKPDFVFSDFMHWLPGLARNLHIKSVHYSAASPVAMGFLLPDGPSNEDRASGPPGFPRPMTLSRYSTRGLKWFETAKEMGSNISMKQRLMTAVKESDAVGFKTCKEIDGFYCEVLEKEFKKPVLLAGPVVPKPLDSMTLDEKWVNWLEKFKPKTVIFCALGSETILQKNQFQQLVLGFELTGLPFLVALRPPSGVDSIEEALPNGFKERTQERGIVYGGWVSQQLLLKHPVVGCFVTHCGYGSMWEGLMSESQFVLLPHMGDQDVNARLMSGELKIGVEVEKGDEDGLFTAEGVCAAVMAVMAEESEIGKEVRANHIRLRELLLSEGFEESYFDEFVQKLRSLLE
ncbi:hypothetical protein RD792_002411 [Penstemon davidsonii]|uniref:Glycosyltransferase n=1 Tax=Penstemon davidsonii TaxID=160366 RepID=A0ABR0DS50_9LAMI|nr:hypothetical protein RD792_002411 [Penstemon davidsonii]